jgi:hypothetical protein
MMPFVVLLTHFPPAYAARACASVGVLQYVATLFIQSALGGVVAIWPHQASGQTSATAYAMAFMVPIALQLAALAWFLFPRSETRDGAQSGEEIVAFARQMRGLSEPPPIPGGLPADAAAALANSAEEPAETAVKPIGSALASTKTAGETAVAASASAETVGAPADTPAEPASLTAEPPDVVATPADSAVEPTDAAVEPTEAALRSILDAPLSVGPGGAIDTALRARWRLGSSEVETRNARSASDRVTRLMRWKTAGRPQPPWYEALRYGSHASHWKPPWPYVNEVPWMGRWHTGKAPVWVQLNDPYFRYTNLKNR